MAPMGMSCEFEGCRYVIQRVEGMPLRIAVGLLELHQDLHARGYTTKYNTKQQVHDTPVPQVKDSEDEVVQQPITNNWTDCKECSIWGTIQDIDSHCQQVHGPAPVRQVEDSEDEVVKQPVAIEWTT